jgi:hypothetical protein
MRRAFSAAVGALSLAAVVAGSSVTAASASAMSSSKTEHFQFAGVSASSNRYSAIAYGAFTAGGTINLKSGLVRVPGGTFRAIHHRTSGKSEFNRRTCLGVSVEHGTYKIGAGTGKYRHINGRGTYTSRVWFVLARNHRGRCSQSKQPAAFQQIVNARGPVRGY